MSPAPRTHSNLLAAPGLLEQVIENAKASYPQEGCGFLVGRGLADRFIAMDNQLASSSAYAMDPASLANVFRELRSSGEALLAIYHSHPHGPARPSRRDIDQAYYPEAAYLIVSLRDPERPESAAFRIVDGEVREIEVHAIV